VEEMAFLVTLLYANRCLWQRKIKEGWLHEGEISLPQVLKKSAKTVKLTF
jgi:hypothetical protein